MTTILHGDCMVMLPLLPENSIDAVVCDPPYHLQSIVDRFGGENAAPAKHGTDGAFARASKGFMGKTWDGGDIAFRKETWEAIYRVLKPGAYLLAFSGSRTFCRVGVAIEDAGFIMHPLHGWIFGQGLPKGHAVNDPEWEGWKYSTQSLKPALEPILMAQKPFSERTGTLNVRRWGTGAINIDGCRVGHETRTYDLKGGENLNKLARQDGNDADDARGLGAFGVGARQVSIGKKTVTGRYPANVTHDGSPEALAAFPDTGDFGSAAQFFYCAKASKADRAGSAHPTVKPLALMRYLCRLITPPGGIVLDPFAGSGTTLQAAVQEGFQAIGIEREAEYVADIVQRMRAI
jgi:site-specific DNA-methyltransferase (adenine-specific)